MADISVESAVSSSSDDRQGPDGPYWSSETVGVIVYIDVGTDINYARTIDGGGTWVSTEIKAGTIERIGTWYDQETPGDSGTKLHIIYMDSVADTVFYRNLDVATDTLGTERTVNSAITVGAGATTKDCSITKTISGNLIACFATATDIECHRSTDEFNTSNDDRADVYEAAASPEDHVMLFPANTGDDDDACAVFMDRDVGSQELTIKMYDESENTWTEFATPIGSIIGNNLTLEFDGVVRHSDNHVLVMWHTLGVNANDDLSAADLTVDSISAPAIAAKTDLYTNQGQSIGIAMLVDQNSDDVYAAYLKGGTWTSTMDVVYHVSTDGMTSWGAEQAYSEAAADDNRSVYSGHSIGSSGGRFMPAWHNEDLTEVFVNSVFSIGIAAVSPPAATTGGHKDYTPPRPLISPLVREREWEEELAAAKARMAANRQQREEAISRTRSRRIPKMSPERARVLRKEKPERYESIIYRKPERKQ